MTTHFKDDLKPYIELARLDKPAGFLLLFWPCSWAIIMASGLSAINYFYIVLFFIGAVAMRGAGCVVNDIIDRDIDAKTERTKGRPLASGRLSVSDASALLVVLCIVGLFVLLNINITAQIYALAAFAMAAIYPFTKRFFSLPQIFLGIAFNSGALVAWAAVTGYISYAAFMLYLAGIFWTIGYDTIYGHQDKKDDLQTGVRSTAISFGKYSRNIIWTCFALSYGLFTYAATISGFDIATFFCLPAIFHLLKIVKRINLDNPSECLKAFQDIAFINGFLFFIGLYISKIII